MPAIHVCWPHVPTEAVVGRPPLQRKASICCAASDLFGHFPRCSDREAGVATGRALLPRGGGQREALLRLASGVAIVFARDPGCSNRASHCDVLCRRSVCAQGAAYWARGLRRRTMAVVPGDLPGATTACLCSPMRTKYQIRPLFLQLSFWSSCVSLRSTPGAGRVTTRQANHDTRVFWSVLCVGGAVAKLGRACRVPAGA